MRNKNAVIFFTVIITLLCLYMLSFTFVARRQQKKALEYATDAKGQINLFKKQEYFDKIYDSVVYNFAGLKYTYKQVLENQLALGLDLQGGMHVTLEASPVEILGALAGSNADDPMFKKAIQTATARQKESQRSFTELFYDSYRDLAGKNKLNRIYANAVNRNKGIDSRSDDAAIEKVINEEVDNAIDRSENILRTRIDKFGALQPNIQRLQNTGRIQVELPGVENQQRVRNLLQGAAKLEFLEVYHLYEVAPALTQINTYLLSIEKPGTKKAGDKLDIKSTEKLLTGDIIAGNSDTTSIKGATASADSLKADTTAPKASSLFALLKAPNSLRYDIKDTAKINDIFANEKVKGMLPANLLLLWERKPYVDDAGNETLELVTVKKPRAGSTTLTGEVISDARADMAQDGKNFEISMQMNTTGAKRWKKMTAEASADPRSKRRIAIVLDDYVYSAPTVQNEIPNGNSSISGNFTFEDAKDLENILKAGKLPVPLRIVEEVVVGPTLGKEAVQQGLVSMAAGLGIVVLFMIFYYSKGGFVADVALIFNVLFILGIMASLPSGAILTLPGIAGIVLTIGMSVDANVLIFERIREEISLGKSIATAINLGYDKAFSSIFDSNVTTLIAGVTLMVLGSGPVQGFAVTLIIGIICSFFTSVYISKVIILYMTRNSKDNNSVSFATVFSKNLFKNLNFDIIGNRKKAYIFSSTIILLGIVSVIVQGGLNLGVDFKGGRSYVIQFNQPVTASDLRSSLTNVFQNASTEVKTYGSNDKLKVTTSYLMEDESTEGDAKVAATLTQGLTSFNAGTFEILSTNKVGATVADDIKSSSWKALLISLVGIFIYVMFRFKKWQFSFGGVVALMHDVLIVIAIFSILRWFGISFEIDQVFVAAILTIVGYSINDTVVVFDRVREFSIENPKMDYPTILNNSINHTFSRTIITALTVFFVVLILCIFGGETLRGFSFAMLIGVVFGSYSSIYIAVPIVLDIGSKNDNDLTLAPVPAPVVKRPVTI